MKKLLFFLTTLTLLCLAWGGAVKAQETLTVYDQGGDNNNYYVPMYGGYFDENTKTEFVIPAAKLEAMNGGTITSMKFYISSVSGTYSWASTQTVFLKEVESDQLSAYSGTDGATVVYTGQFTAPEATETEFEITFQTPYEYHGGNLLVGIYNSAGGSSHYRFVYWYGENVNGASGSGNSSSSMAYVSFSQKNFIPMTTFTYEPAQQGGCAKPGAITLGTAGATEFPISWTAGGEETSWNVYLTQGGSPVEGYNPLVVNNPSCTFSGLTAGTTYNVAIEAICGDEVSNQRTTSFATEMCEPTDMCQISVYRYDQYDDSWNGGSIAIMQNGNLVATVNCPSGSSETTVNYTVCKDVPVSFDFTRGDYPGEIGVTITDGGGGVVYESTNMSSVSAGTFLTIDNACPSCYKVLNLNHQDETTNGVTLTWDADPRNDASVTYTIYNVTDDVVYASEVSATSQLISGLNENTPYVFTVTTDCGSGDLSDTATVNFTTLASCPAPSATLTDGSVWARGATIGWNDMGSTSYNVRYQVNNTIVEDFESDAIANGWSLVNSTSSYTQVSSSAAYNGSLYGFQFEYSEQNDASLISPVLNGTENGVSISFYYKESSDYYGDEQFHVGYSSDENATDPDDFTYGDIVTASTSWQQYENTFPAGTKRIAIKYVYNNTLYLYIDDINIVIPNDDWTTENTTNTSYPISNLDPETRYLAQVQSVCGEDLSSWSEGVSFTTDVACHAPTSLAKVGDAEARQVALRWNETWANTNWQICLNGNEENLINVTGADATIDNEWRVTYTLTGLTPDQDYSLKVRSNCGNGGPSQWSNTIYIHTAVACSAPTTLNNGTPGPNQVELTWVKTGVETAWQVCVNDNEENLVEVEAADVTVNTETNVVTYTLTGLTPSESYVVKVRANCGGEDGTSAWSNTANFNAAASCPAPVLAAEGITNITGHTADVAWTGFNENQSYVVSYRTAAYFNGTTEEFGSSLPTGWTRYGGLVDGVVAGTTELNTTSINSPSWSISSNAFSTYNATLNIYGNSCNRWFVTPEITLANGSAINFDLALTDYGNSDEIENNTAQSDDRFAVLIYANDAWTILREWNNSGSSYVYNNIPANGENVQIDLSSYSGTVKIAFYGESTVGSNGDNDIHIDNVAIGVQVAAGTWQTVSPNPTAASAQLTGLTADTPYEVKVKGNCENNNESEESAVRTFRTTIACPAPTALTFVSATTNTATVTWTSSLSAWIVAYKAETDNSYTEVNTTDNPFTIPNLAPANNYMVKVKADCSANNDGESEWSNEISFHTDCPDNFPLNYTCGFEGPNTTGSNVLPLCWTRMGSQYYPAAIDNVNNAHEGTRYLVFSKTSNYPNSIAALPAIGADLNTVRISFYGKLNSTSADGTINVGYVTDLDDATTFNTVQTVTLTTSYEKYTVSFGNVNPETSGYIALQSLYNTATATIYIDDITVEAIPDCAEPTNLQFVSSTTTTATLQWIAGGSETAWDIYYSTENVAPTSSTTPLVSATTDNPATINDLTASSIYYVWVRAHCSASDKSPWFGGISFSTKCNARTDFPITYGFETSEGFQTGVTYATDAPTTNNLGNCWRNEYTSTTSTYNRLWCTGTSYYKTGSQSLMLPDKSNFNTTLLAFPAMNFSSANGYKVSFWIRRDGQLSSGTNYEGFKVYASNTDTIDDNAVDLGLYSRYYNVAYPKIESSSDWYQYDIYIPQATITGIVYLIFEGQSYFVTSTYVDDIVIEEAPSCLPVGALADATNITATSADLSWTLIDNTQNQWKIEIATNEAFENFGITNTYITNPTLDGLTPETHYWVRVKAICGNDFGAPSNVIDFTTGPVCSEPTGIYFSNISPIIDSIVWDAVNGGSWQTIINYGNIQTVPDENEFANRTPSSNNYALFSHLTPGQDYTFFIRRVCGNGSYHSDVVTYHFVPVNVCYAPTLLNTGVDNVTANSATVTWDGTSDSYTVSYKANTENTWQTEEVTAATTVELANLTAATTYQVMVQGHCGNVNSEVSDVVEFTTDLCLPADMCELTFELTDSYGDGWNGNKIKVIDVASGQVLATMANENLDNTTNAEETQTIPLPVCDGRDISFEWVSGGYSYETSYIVYDNNGAEIFSGSAGNNLIDNYTVSCSAPVACNVPTGLYTVAVGADTAKVRWVAGGEETVWNLRYHIQGENNWNTETTQGDSTFTFTQLTANSEYEWQVQAVCGANLTSDWSSLGTFTTEAEPQVTCHEWQLVTSANDLQNGDQIIIAASGNYNVAMSTTQKDNNRDVATIIKDGNKLTLPVGDDVQVLTANYLATNNAWTLYTGEGYLYAASSSSNHLRTEEEIDEYGNAYWTITFSNGVASIVANGNNSRNIMKYNNNSSIISCYASGQSPLAIYRLIDNRRLATKDTTVAHALPFTFTMAGQPDTIITSYGEFNLSYVIEADPVNCDSVLNVHLTVNEPMFTVTLNAGAGTITLPAQLTGNSTHPVDLANLVPELDNNCTEWTFAGWSSAAVAETNDAPDFVTTISPTSDTTLYAVYVKSEGGSGDAIWQKANTIAIGDQMVLVYETGKYELSGISTTSTKYGERVSYSVAPTGVYPLTVVAGTAAASYSLKTSDDNYLTWTSGNSLNKASSVTDNSSWSISFDNDGNADIANISQDTRKIRYNTSSPRFACYESGQSAIQLYKLSNPVVNTYNSNPVCDVNYNITLVQPADGSISSDPAQTASAGAVVTLTATPNAGYTFESWEVRNLATGGTVEVTNDQFTMPAANVEVHASFTAIEYTVTATANPAAGGTITGTGTYSYEGAASLTASANNGYEFVNWTNEQGAVVCTTATYNFIVTRDSALTANFALKEYTITMSVVTGGTLSHNLPANVATMGTEVTLIATPNEGFQFDGDWTVQNISASSPVEVVNNKFTMPAGNVTVTGYFSPITYTVSAVISPDNAGSVSGTGSYNHGAEAQLRATPASGYEFVNWTNAQGAVVSTDADYNFIVNRDSALTANFELKEYTITMSVVSGGTLSHNLPANVATMGTEVTLIATPDEGFQFDGDWYVQNTSASSPVTVENNKFTMPAGNVTVTGYFSYITYTVSAVVSPANAGSVTGTGSFNHGAEVQLTANPATGYEFVNWTNAQGAVVCTTATYNFNVTSDSALTANFALKEYTITYMDGNTTLHIDTFAFGAAVTPYADPTKECVEFTGWNETIPSTMPANDVVLNAQWRDLYYNLTANVTPANAGNVTLDPQPATGTTAANSGYVCGTQVTLTATPAEGYRFINWTVGATEISTATSVNVTVNSDTTIVANFQALEKVATPTFTPVAGTYTEPKTVTIACATPGAVIYYTTDGTEPTANSTQYTDGFELNANTTVKAIAMKDGNDWLPSDVATAEYIFNFPLYTVTFIPGTNGTVTKDTMMGNAFTHPVDFANNSAVPAADCQTLGWSFVGWSTAAVQETPTAPTTLVTSPYSPTDNITLYAVYQQDNNAEITSSVDFSTMGYSDGTAVGTVDINNNTAVTFGQGSNANNNVPKYYSSGAAVRCYAYNTITVASQDAMTGITFTFGSGENATAITANVGDYSDGVWSGNATSVVFTIGGSGQRRIATITVNQGGTVTTYNSDPDCIITYPIELATVQNGTIGADKTEAAEGETVTLNATPATGYHFGLWNVTTATTPVENVAVTNNTFEMPASAVTVSADFWIDTLIILATPNPANGGTVTGEDEYEYGTQVTLTATPANDYYFTGWTSNGTQVSTDATFTFTATQDSDLVANFEAKQMVATPTISPAAGTYTEPKTVTISCATQGATIYYTTDGTEPAANSTQYTDGFELYANTTVKAIAMKDGAEWLPSEVATAEYTFNFPIYTVTFNPGNGTVPQATMTGNQFTEAVDFANNVPSPAAACTDWTFAGWSTAEVTETTTEPTFVTSPYNPSADITLYAVYQKTEQGTGTATPARYVKVTSAPNDWSGDYLIVYEDIEVAFNGGLSTLDATSNYIDVDINNGVIASTATTDAAKFTIASMTTGYSIKSASGYYIGRIANSNGMNTSMTDQYSNNFSISGGTVTITSSSNPTLKFNSDNNQKRFRYFKSGQQDIVLYKYEPATATDVTTYNSNPVCSYMVYVDGNMQNGTVTVDPATATTEGAAIGSTVTLTPVPATGYHFGSWNVTKLGTTTVENVEVSANNTFVMPTTDVNVSAIFWVDTLTIAATVDPQEGGSVTGAGEYEYNTEATLTATPTDLYLFTNWTVNGTPVSTDAAITFTVTQDSAFVANFTHKDTVATPTFDPAAGTHTFLTGTGMDVTILCATPNATIYYTVDGSDPVLPSRNVTGTQVYTGPFTLDEDGITTVKAIAVAEDMLPSEMATITYRLVKKHSVMDCNSVNCTVEVYDPNASNVNHPYVATYADTLGANMTVHVDINEIVFKLDTIYANDFDGNPLTIVPVDNPLLNNYGFTMPDTNVCVTAEASYRKYSVHYVTNGGVLADGLNVDTFYIYGQMLMFPTAEQISKPGSEFLGWYADPNFSGSPTSGLAAGSYVDNFYVYAKWSDNSYTFRVNYRYDDGRVAASPHVEVLNYGDNYNVASPAIATYMPDQPVVSGTMGAGSTIVTVVYTQIVMNAVDNQTVCTDGTTAAVEFSLPASLTQTFPSMDVMFEKAIDNTTIGIADETYGNIASFTAVNAGTAPVVSNITVTPLCTLDNHAVRGVPQTFSITVNPKHTSEFSETACDSYVWNLNGSDTTIVDEGTNDYVHVFQNRYGCDSTVTLHLTLYKTPTALTYTTEANTSCDNAAPNGKITVTAPTGNFEYSLDGIDWQTEVLFENLAANNYTVYVRPVNSECAYTETVIVSDNIVMPVATASVANDYYCAAAIITLDGTGSSTGTDITYAWSGPNNFTSAVISPTLTSNAQPFHAGTYTLTVTNTTTNCSSETTVDVVVNAPNAAGYAFTVTTHGDVYANVGTTPTFVAPEVNHFLGATCLVDTTNDYDATTMDAIGTYTITWTVTDACGNTATATQTLHVSEDTGCPVATDIEGNTYPTVVLAGKCWMAKNLRTTKFSDGRDVTNLMVYDNIMYPNTTENLDRYGYLYDWANAMDAPNGTVTFDANNNVQGICPTGWHLPTNSDFMDIAGPGSATDMFDLRYNQYWLDGGGNNSTNYSMLPGGCYNDNTGRYENLLGNAYFWGVNTTNPSQPRVYWADCKCYMWQVNDTTPTMGYSVRCIKD